MISNTCNSAIEGKTIRFRNVLYMLVAGFISCISAVAIGYLIWRLIDENSLVGIPKFYVRELYVIIIPPIVILTLLFWRLIFHKVTKNFPRLSELEITAFSSIAASLSIITPWIIGQVIGLICYEGTCLHKIEDPSCSYYEFSMEATLMWLVSSLPFSFVLTPTAFKRLQELKGCKFSKLIASVFSVILVCAALFNAAYCFSAFLGTGPGG